MTEETSGRKMIMKLATAYRISFPDNEKPKQARNPLETFGNINVETEHFQLTDISGSFKITENEETKNANKGNEMIWDKVFIKLRPPSKSCKGKSLHPGVKFLNRTCEEIVDIIKPFSKDKMQENKVTRQAGENVKYDLQKNSTCFEVDEDGLEITQSNRTHMSSLFPF